MNKITKATIATAAGAALLLGGAGTFATWNDTQSFTSGASITAGNLDVIDGPAGTWTAKGSTTPINDIATYLVVPGDVLTYTKTMQIEAKGDSMRAELTLAEGAIAPSSADPADVALFEQLTQTAEFSAVGEGIEKNAAGEFIVTPTGDIEEVTVTVTLTFDDLGVDAAGNGANNASKRGSVDLSAFTVAITQLLPASTV